MKLKTPFIIKRILNHRVSQALFHLFPSERKRGSAAIILSLMVSGAVLSTIFHSQKNIDWFLSTTTSSLQDWLKALTAKYGFTLGGYLVANNLILCKEGGWGDNGALCKWNPESSLVESVFNLNSPVQQTVDGKKVLSFKGHIQEPTLNQGRRIDYSISFDLVNWKDSKIKNIMGEIPTAICRNPNTLEIISGYCARGQDKCKTNQGGSDIANSVCEYISEVDQDYYIVLMSVQPSASSPSEEPAVYQAGIRRPLVHLNLSLDDSPKCGLSCSAGSTAQTYPECRGDFEPVSGEDQSPLRFTVTNKGPGTLYDLALLRQEESLIDKDANGKNLVFYRPTGNLFEKEGLKYLLPGQSFDTEEMVACYNEVKYRIITDTKVTRSVQYQRVGRNPVVNAGRRILDTGTTTSTEGVNVAFSRNVHAHPMVRISYTMDSLAYPTGLCVERSVGEDGSRKLIPGNCGRQYAVNQSCGAREEGVCLFSHIEPRRTFYPAEIEDDSQERKKEIETLTYRYTGNVHITTVVRYYAPH